MRNAWFLGAVSLATLMSLGTARDAVAKAIENDVVVYPGSDPTTWETASVVGPSASRGEASSANPGWFVVIQQHPSALRFRLRDWTGQGPLTPESVASANGLTETTAATIADALAEEPYRLAIHASRFFGAA